MFAASEDVRLRWAQAPEGNAVLDARIEDASVWLRAMFPKIPQTLSPQLAGVLKVVVCAMVKRAMLSDGADNLAQLSHTAGPFTQSQTFRNAEGNLFLTAQERDMLEAALESEIGGRGGMMTMEATGW